MVCDVFEEIYEGFVPFLNGPVLRVIKYFLIFCHFFCFGKPNLRKQRSWT